MNDPPYNSKWLLTVALIWILGITCVPGGDGDRKACYRLCGEFMEEKEEQEEPKLLGRAWGPSPRYYSPPRYSPSPRYTPSPRYSPPVYRPSAPVWRPSQPVYRPTQPVWRPSQPAFRPSQPVYRPNQPVWRPSQPVYRPNQPVWRPSQPVYRPNQPVWRPKQPVWRPAQPVYRPVQQGYRGTPGTLQGSWGGVNNNRGNRNTRFEPPYNMPWPGHWPGGQRPVKKDKWGKYPLFYGQGWNSDVRKNVNRYYADLLKTHECSGGSCTARAHPISTAEAAYIAAEHGRRSESRKHLPRSQWLPGRVGDTPVIIPPEIVAKGKAETAAAAPKPKSPPPSSPRPNRSGGSRIRSVGSALKGLFGG